MVNPSEINDPFWDKTQLITQQAAKSFGIELNTIYSNSNRFFQLEAIKAYFKTNKKRPEYVILVNYPGNAKTTMDFLQLQNVKVITLIQTLPSKEKSLIGKPGEKYKNWLGEVNFNNKQAGFLLAENLFKQLNNENELPVVAGISGDFGSEALLRNQGLLLAANQYSATFTQIVHSHWSPEDAYIKTLKLLKRYPKLNVIWAASDSMALGALKAAEELGRTPGKDIIIGGFDLTPNAIKSINNHKLSSSIGGQFMMGAIAMIAIKNIKNGIKHHILIDSSNRSFNLELIDKTNVKRYFNVLTSDKINQIDFDEIEKLYSQDIKTNPFSLLEMLDK